VTLIVVKDKGLTDEPEDDRHEQATTYVYAARLLMRSACVPGPPILQTWVRGNVISLGAVFPIPVKNVQETGEPKTEYRAASQGLAGLPALLSSRRSIMREGLWRMTGRQVARATACFLYNYVCGKLRRGIRAPYPPHSSLQRTALGRLGNNHRS
jgi:hypothetical protein